MQLTTLALLLLSTLTTALPSPSNTKRACPHVNPTGTQFIDLVNRPNLNPPQTKTQTVTFNLPSPASSLQGPCTLKAVFPAYWNVSDSSVQAGGQPLPVNVYAVDGPAPGALVGVARFGGPIAEPRTVWINSFACRDVMTYRLELAGVGEVRFLTGYDKGSGIESGLEIAWGC